MRSVIIIPARYSSSRFPGKPLVSIKGKSMLERTWRIASAVGADEVVVATDDQRIEELASSFGARVSEWRRNHLGLPSWPAVKTPPPEHMSHVFTELAFIAAHK